MEDKKKPTKKNDEKSKEEYLPFSCIPRLEEEYNDISYDTEEFDDQ